MTLYITRDGNKRSVQLITSKWPKKHKDMLVIAPVGAAILAAVAWATWVGPLAAGSKWSLAGPLFALASFYLVCVFGFGAIQNWRFRRWSADLADRVRTGAILKVPDEVSKALVWAFAKQRMALPSLAPYIGEIEAMLPIVTFIQTGRTEVIRREAADRLAAQADALVQSVLQEQAVEAELQRTELDTLFPKEL